MLDKKLQVVYADAAEKYVKAVVLYGNDHEGALYYDAECSEQVPGKEVLNFCFKGLVIYDIGQCEYYTPTGFVDLSDKTIVYVISAGEENSYTCSNELEAE